MKVRLGAKLLSGDLSTDPDLLEGSPLKLLIAALGRLGLRYWIDQGTLLGLVRERRLIPHDDDIDVSVWFPEIDGSRSTLVRKLRALGLEVDECYLYGLSVRKQGCLRPVNVAYMFLAGDKARKLLMPPRQGFFSTRLMNVVTRIHRNLDGTKEEGKHDGPRSWLPDLCCRHLPENGSRWLAWALTKIYFRYNSLIVVDAPALHFETTRELDLEGFVYSLPYASESYLEYKYGSGWRTPRAGWCYWLEDGGLTAASQGSAASVDRYLRRDEA